MATAQKLCFILQAEASEYYLYLEDLSNDKMLNDREYSLKKASVVLLHEFGCLCFCNVDNMLYMFEGSEAGEEREETRKSVYVYPLANHLNMHE